MANQILKIGLLLTTSRIDVYTFDKNGKINSFLITNDTTTRNNVDIFINLIRFKRVVIPAGVGTAVMIPELIGSYNTNTIISIQPTDPAQLNYVITGYLEDV